jgi:hypothetical protein
LVKHEIYQYFKNNYQFLTIHRNQAHLHQESTRQTCALPGGQWREAKGFRAYLVNGERIIHLFSWHQIQNEEQMQEKLLFLLPKLGSI